MNAPERNARGEGHPSEVRQAVLSDFEPRVEVKASGWGFMATVFDARTGSALAMAGTFATEEEARAWARGDLAWP